MGSWDDQDTLIIAFPEHNCSEWNYNDSHVTFKPSSGKIISLYTDVVDSLVTPCICTMCMLCACMHALQACICVYL